MNKDKYVFAQLVGILDNFKFLRIVRKYACDKYIKSYTCWNQLLTMMFGQLSNRESLRDLIVALEAHAGKVYHLGIGKSVTRSNLSKANEQRDYRIFEEFAFFMIAEARRRRIQKIFELDGHVYAFDSTTIDLCLSVFEWAKFRKHKGGIKIHTLYDVEAQVPAFVHITQAKVHDSKAMPEIPYEKGAHCIFDRGYNDFGNLYTINRIEAFFVVRAKTNVRFKPETWKRRLPENVVSDATGYFTVYKSAKDYPEKQSGLHRSGRRYRIHLPDKQSDGLSRDNRRTVPQPVERGAVLQMDRTALAHQEVLGNIRKCCPHPNLLCHNYLLPCGNSAARHETGAKHLRSPSNSWYLADGQNQSARPLRQIEFQKCQCSLWFK